MKRDSSTSAGPGSSSQDPAPQAGPSGAHDNGQDYFRGPSSALPPSSTVDSSSSSYFPGGAAFYPSSFEQQARHPSVAQLHHSALLSSLDRGGAAMVAGLPPALSAAGPGGSRSADNSNLFPLLHPSAAVPPAPSHSPFYASSSVPFLLPGRELDRQPPPPQHYRPSAHDKPSTLERSAADSDIPASAPPGMLNLREPYVGGGGGLQAQAPLKRKLGQDGASSYPLLLEPPPAVQRDDAKLFGGGQRGGGSMLGSSSEFFGRAVAPRTPVGGSGNGAGGGGVDEESRALAGILRLSQAREVSSVSSRTSSSSSSSMGHGGQEQQQQDKKQGDAAERGRAAPPPPPPPPPPAVAAIELAALKRPPALPPAAEDERFVELGKQAIVRAYLDLAKAGQASRGRTLGIL